MLSHSEKNHLLYISGGARSGKSHYAEQRALAITGQRSYIATCPILDDEMAARIAHHRHQRSGQGWRTIEEPQDLIAALNSAHDSAVVLVDCITLWINNLLYHAQSSKQELDETWMRATTLKVIEAARQCQGTVIFVSNELGMGIVPADALSRRYRDLVGRCNQTLAEQADEAVLLVSGLPLTLKGI